MQKIIVIIFFFLPLLISGQNVNIGLFYGSKISTLTVTVLEGEYEIQHNSIKKSGLSEGEIAYITVLNGYLQVRRIDGLVGTFESINLTGTSKENVFSIKPVEKELNPRIYEDNLFIKVKDSTLILINDVNLEKYIAGVVETEAGSTAELEFYKSQALICRTYAYNNFNRHHGEGFNLCDGVHCQAYKNRSYYNKLIPKAAYHTRSLIVVDSAYIPINAAFHSNSGGQTANSEDVWISKKHYLKSVIDPLSLNGNSFKWTKTISPNEWKNYLINNNFDIPDTVQPGYFNFQQPARMRYYKIGNDSVAFNQLRTDYNLRSAFFSVKSDTANVTFIGKGYGHGVGLSQEGGMEMARQGKTYEDIINFYFKDVKIISFKELNKSLIPDN